MLQGIDCKSLIFGIVWMPAALSLHEDRAYNVNGINVPILLKWLKESVPDVVCLQELKAPDESFPVDAIGNAGFGAIWHGQKSWNGVAILAYGKQPILMRRGLPGDPDDTHSVTSRRQSTAF
jgi:exonuclease III